MQLRLTLTDGGGEGRNALHVAQVGGQRDALPQLRQFRRSGPQLLLLAGSDIGFHTALHETAGDHAADATRTAGNNRHFAGYIKQIFHRKLPLWYQE